MRRNSLAAVPVSTWNYKTQDASVRHMGPMAQDLHAGFGLGVSDKGIDTIDADGISLAAIQGLYQLVKDTQQKLNEKESQIASQSTEIAELRAQIKALAEKIGAAQTK